MSRAAVIVPVLDGADAIESVVRSLLPPDAPSRLLFVADGGSRDGTVEVVSRLAAQDPRVRLVANPARVQAAGVNAAVAELPADVDVFVRADVRCVYPEGWVETLVDAMGRTGADSVVVPMRTVAEDDGFQSCVAAAQNSVLGNGGSAHRSAPRSDWVDHGHHAAFGKATFASLGGYDPAFAVNEDAEYDARLVASGGRVWMEGAARIDYLPRRTPAALARQYFRYGRGRAATVLKHGILPKPRQAIPAAIVAGIAGSVALAPLIGWPIALATPAYALACLAVAARAAPDARRVVPTAAAAMIMHLAWGSGFIAGIASGAPRRFAAAGAAPVR